MTGGQEKYTFDRVVRMVLTTLAVVGVFFLLRYLSDVLLPFALAVVLAYLLNPIVTSLEARTSRRGVAVGLTLTGLLVVAAASILVVVPLVISQMSRFGTSLEKLQNDLAETVAVRPIVPQETPDSSDSAETAADSSTLGWSELVDGWGEFHDPANEHSRAERFAALRQEVSGTVLGRMLEDSIAFVKSDAFRGVALSAAKQVAVGGWTVVSFVVSFMLALTGLIIVLIYLVFLLLDYPEYVQTARDLLPPNYKDEIIDFLGQFNTALRQYFRGQSLVAFFVGTLFAVGFTVMGLPMAVPFGLFIGLLNMVPYLQLVAILPAMILAGLRALEGDASFVGSVAMTLGVFAVVQVIQDALLVPRIMGKVTGLRPVAILLGVFIWGKLLGFLGLLLAIPLTCLGIAYYRRFVLLKSAASTRIKELA
jgi:predicted PurR-regulated permease PerM